MVLAMIAVALRRLLAIRDLGTNRVGVGGAARVVFVVFLEELLLNRFGESVDGVTGLGLARRLRDRYAAADGHDAFAAYEAESGILAAAIHEIHAQREIESRM